MINNKGLWICQCCAFQFDSQTGERRSTGLGRNPVLCKWADHPGWGVYCPDCGVEVTQSTKEKVIESWNELNSYNEVSLKIKPIILTPEEEARLLF